MNKLKFDLHIHTAEVSSCALVKASEMVQMYKDAGYQGVVITDHFFNQFFDKIEGSWEEKVDAFLEGYNVALEEGQKLGLDVLMGMELRFSCSDNDYLVFGIDRQFLLDNPNMYEMTPQTFKELIKDKDILIFQAHPFRPGCCKTNPEFLDGIEVYNGNPRHDSNNKTAYKFALDNELYMSSGSDFHEIEDLARGGILIEERIQNNAELIKLLKQLKEETLINLPK